MKFLTIEVVYMFAVVVLSIGLLLWFILNFVPSVLNLRDDDNNKLP